MARLPHRGSAPEEAPTRVWVQAFKASLLVCLTLILLCATALYLADGRRIPIGSGGVTVLRDVNGQPYLVVDRRKAPGMMVALDLSQVSLQVYTGAIHF